jgi:hypothetical protein
MRANEAVKNATHMYDVLETRIGPVPETVRPGCRALKPCQSVQCMVWSVLLKDQSLFVDKIK